MTRLLCKAALVAVAVAGSACTMTFDGVNGTGNPTFYHLVVNEQGQSLAFDSTHDIGFQVVGQPAICQFGGCVDNGTVYIAQQTMVGASGEGIIEMLRNGPLSLSSFEVAQLFLDDATAAAAEFPNATTVVVVGQFLGGETVQTTCPVPDTGFATCTVPSSFANLVRVRFTGLAAAGGAGAIAIDNISYSPGG